MYFCEKKEVGVIMKARTKKTDIPFSKTGLFISSQKDLNIFFEAIANPPAPNLRIKLAAKRYIKMVGLK
jgi:uncharacterized protein (DUF1778 family)